MQKYIFFNDIGVGGESEVQERRDIHIPMADSSWCMAETNIIL